MKGYADRFRKMADELQRHRSLEVTKCEFGSPAAPEQIAEYATDLTLPRGFAEFCAEVNGIHIEWKLKDGVAIPGASSPVMGRLRLLPLDEVFQDWEDIIYFSKDDKFRPLQPLDFFVAEACAAFYYDRSENPTVYYHYCGEEMSSMGVDFRGYLELLLKSRGFWYWQLSIASPEFYNPYVPVSAEEKNFRQVMPQLFSDFRSEDFAPMPRG